MNRFIVMFMLVFVAGSIGCDTNNTAEDRIEDRIETQKDSIEDRADRAKDSLDSLKAVYQARMDSVDTTYAIAEREYNDATGREKTARKRRLDSLGVRRDELRAKWNELKNATNETWNNVKQEWDELWNNYDAEYRRKPGSR